MYCKTDAGWAMGIFANVEWTKKPRMEATENPDEGRRIIAMGCSAPSLKMNYQSCCSKCQTETEGGGGGGGGKEDLPCSTSSTETEEERMVDVEEKESWGDKHPPYRNMVLLLLVSI